MSSKADAIPCSGYRTARHAEQIEEPSVILLSYLAGGEDIEFGGERYTSQPVTPLCGTVHKRRLLRSMSHCTKSRWPCLAVAQSQRALGA